MTKKATAKHIHGLFVSRRICFVFSSTFYMDYFGICKQGTFCACLNSPFVQKSRFSKEFWNFSDSVIILSFSLFYIYQINEKNKLHNKLVNLCEISISPLKLDLFLFYVYMLSFLYHLQDIYWACQNEQQGGYRVGNRN